MVQAYAGEGATASSINVSPSSSSINIKTHEQIVIQQGDTLWDIASSHKNRNEDIRSYILKLKSLNHMTNSALQEGQVLLLP
ncbi:LysM peptidoglycan-binding domain-containing protein [Paenibacillus sp. N3.4]|nr:LysM peptidoglycan-binding domain-containing protein [Paenibacillus sp. N3.4]